jgi:glutathionyl-hydroquinone reductase
MVRKLKKLEAAVPMTVVHPDMLENGWTFGGEVDAVTGRRFLYEIYRDADPGFSGHATVPVLWDTETRTIVNNESSEIIRMLNRDFDEWGGSISIPTTSLRKLTPSTTRSTAR